MFTGLVADLGTVTAVEATPDGVRLAVRDREQRGEIPVQIERPQLDALAGQRDSIWLDG